MRTKLASSSSSPSTLHSRSGLCQKKWPLRGRRPFVVPPLGGRRCRDVRPRRFRLKAVLRTTGHCLWPQPGTKPRGSHTGPISASSSLRSGKAPRSGLPRSSRGRSGSGHSTEITVPASIAGLSRRTARPVARASPWAGSSTSDGHTDPTAAEPISRWSSLARPSCQTADSRRP